MRRSLILLCNIYVHCSSRNCYYLENFIPDIIYCPLDIDKMKYIQRRFLRGNKSRTYLGIRSTQMDQFLFLFLFEQIEQDLAMTLL